LSFGLTTHPKKTKLIRFGRFALAQCRDKPSRGKPGAFDFLGFTHYIDKKLSGELIVKRKTKRNRQLAQLKRIKLALRKRLHDKPWETGRWLRRVVQGHINYYVVPYNGHKLGQFIEGVKKLWLKSLSQRHRMTWERFKYYMRYWLPKLRIVHPYPEQRFYSKYPK
jgi:RNA-directed DNA polymerase